MAPILPHCVIFHGLVGGESHYRVGTLLHHLFKAHFSIGKVYTEASICGHDLQWEPNPGTSL